MFVQLLVQLTHHQSVAEGALLSNIYKSQPHLGCFTLSFNSVLPDTLNYILRIVSGENEGLYLPSCDLPNTVALCSLYEDNGHSI